MKKSTFRIVRSIGMFLFLLLFGIFIYVLSKAENQEHNDIAFSPRSEPQDFDELLNSHLENRQIGFEYQNIPKVDS